MMKRFIFRILTFFGIPIFVLAIIYLLIDPFKTLRPFSFQYFDTTNRDYISSELFLRNNPSLHYNSFIFGSSRSGGFNSYHWKHYLPEGSTQFVFQSWSESITGIEQKIDYLDNHGNELNNALILLDIPGAFSKEQQPKKVLTIKHYRFSGQSKFRFQCCLFYGFIQKPSKWYSSVKQFIKHDTLIFPMDTISNDWGTDNHDVDVNIQPEKDSLCNCTTKTKAIFLKQIENKSELDLVESKPLISNQFMKQLVHIKVVFDKHHTDYRIVISPAYCYTNPRINEKDLKILQDIFGTNRVFNYSGKNSLTEDCFNFSDPDHFGQSVGWQIIEDIYNK